MRIAHFVSGFPVLSETFVRDEIGVFQERGFGNVVVSIRPRPRDACVSESCGLEGIFYPKWNASSLWRGIGLFSHLNEMSKVPGEFGRNLYLHLMAPSVIDFLRGRRIDHCHAHFAHYPATLAWICSRQIGATFSFNAHSYDLYRYRSFLSRKVQDADAVFPISDLNRKHLLESASLSPEQSAKIRTIHCGIGLSQYPFQATSLSPSRGNSPLLLAVGRLVDTKGFHILLESLPPVLDRFPHLRTEIVGEGPERENLARQAERLGIADRVTLLGGLDRESTRKKQAEADLVVQPCCEGRNGLDGIPVVLMEAMALGTPVVSTRFAAIPELIEPGVSGLLVPPADPQALAQAVVSILDGRVPIESLRKNARAVIEEGYDGPRNYRRKAEILARIPKK